MAKSKQKESNKPDIVISFASPEQAARFCYALERHFAEETSEVSSVVRMKSTDKTVGVWAPVRHFDTIKEISCEFGRKTCRQHTASR